MKKLYNLCIIFSFISSVSLFAGDPRADVSITEIKPDLFCIVHSYPWPANSVVSVMQNGDILIIDTPYTPEAMESVLGWIQDQYGHRNILAINTHFHVDRLGGNAALVKHSIPIYSSELTIKAIQERGAQAIQWTASLVKDSTMKAFYSNFKYIPPTKLFESSKGLELHFGTETVYVKYLGIGHSVDNLFVFLPQKKVLYGGCAILCAQAQTPGNVSDGDKTEWLKTIARIDTTGYDCVIPGHGGIGGLDLIRHTAEILSK